MTFDDLESIARPLMAAWPARDARWLNKLFRSSAAYDLFTALENELFVGKASPYNGSLLIASETHGEGRSTIALLLAVMSSAFDPSRRILLVDADTDHGRLSALFASAEQRPGLRELFAGTVNNEGCIGPTAIPNLWLTPLSGDARGGVRLSPLLFERFIDQARSTFDLIVVDSPAAGSNRAILSMARVVRNVLIVIKYGGPTRQQVQKLKFDLERSDANVIGCVLNQREFVVPRLLYGSS